MIQFFYEEVETLSLNEKTVNWLTGIIVSEQKKAGKITYIFCTDEALLKVNKEFLDHDYYTDVITFDYVKGKIISADIFVSLPRISENAISLNKDFNSELHRVLAHGILHLCGYNDKTDDEIQQMRQKEDFYLSLI